MRLQEPDTEHWRVWDPVSSAAHCLLAVVPTVVVGHAPLAGQEGVVGGLVGCAVAASQELLVAELPTKQSMYFVSGKAWDTRAFGYWHSGRTWQNAATPAKCTLHPGRPVSTPASTPSSSQSHGSHPAGVGLGVGEVP